MWGSEDTSSTRKDLDAMIDRQTDRQTLTWTRVLNDKAVSNSVNELQDYAEGVFQTLQDYCYHKKVPAFKG